MLRTMSAVKILNRISFTLLVLCVLMMTYRVTNAVVAYRAEGHRVAEENQRLGNWVEQLREYVSRPQNADLEHLDSIIALMTEAEASLADSNRRVAAFTGELAVVRGFHVLWRGYSEWDEFVAAHRRAREQVNALDALVNESAQAKGGRNRCYCSCAGAGGAPSVRGRKTARQCADLCASEGYTQAICT